MNPTKSETKGFNMAEYQQAIKDKNKSLDERLEVAKSKKTTKKTKLVSKNIVWNKHEHTLDERLAHAKGL
jgi:hypothetical protein